MRRLRRLSSRELLSKHFFSFGSFSLVISLQVDMRPHTGLALYGGLVDIHGPDTEECLFKALGGGCFRMIYQKNGDTITNFSFIFSIITSVRDTCKTLISQGLQYRKM